MIYYNDNDPNSVAWLRELIARGLIAKGVVDDRSILDVQPDDLRGFTQCHFFAGIGAWSYALRLAGWPDDRPVWTGSPPCFPEEVLVTTKRGFVPIKEVVVGDLCLTHTGNWKPVVRVGSAIKPTVEMVGQGHFGLRTTHDHPFFARGRKIKSTRRKGKGVRIHEIGDSHWRKAKDMVDFWWAMPARLPGLTLPIYPSGYTDAELGLLCGLYIGDGWITKGNSKDNLVLGLSEKKADEIEAALPNLRFSRHTARTGVRLVLNDTSLGIFLRDHFGQGSTTKTLPLWLFAGSPELQGAFVSGWDMTDGTREEIAGSRRITTTSRDLAVIGRMLLVTMGFSVSMRKIFTPENTTIEGRTVNQADYYTLSRSNCARYSFSDDLHKWFKVKSVVDHGETVKVYDIEVADDHSYIADGIAVHNCQPFSVAGLGLAVDDPRHLSPKFASLVRACRPDVLFGEQVASAQVFGSSAKPSRKGTQGAPAWAWLDDLCDRLEAAQYAIGASDIPSAGVGAPHQRQRTFFGAIRLADGLGERLEGHGGHGDDRDQSGRVGAFSAGSASSGGAVGRLADAEHDDRRSDIAGRGSEGRTADGGSGAALLLDERGRSGPTNGFWRDADWLFCRDELWRPVVASYVEMADGPSARMGRGRADFLGDEEVETRLQAMRDTFDEKEIQRQAGGQWRFQEEGVLRSLLHGRLDGGSDQEPDPSEQQTSVCENCGADVRSLPSTGHKVPCASCGRESSEQRPLELEDIVHLLPPSLALAELWGRREDAKRLRLLQRRLDEEGSVLHPPLAGKEAWASLGKDAKDRVRLDFDVGAWRRVVSFPLVDGNAFKQGSGHLFEGKSRAAMLKGYGNAINPWAAKVYIESFCEAVGIPLVPDYLDALGLKFTY